MIFPFLGLTKIKHMQVFKRYFLVSVILPCFHHGSLSVVPGLLLKDLRSVVSAINGCQPHSKMILQVCLDVMKLFLVESKHGGYVVGSCSQVDINSMDSSQAEGDQVSRVEGAHEG